MTSVPKLHSMNVSQLHTALVKLDVDLWSSVSEQEMVTTFERCVATKSPVIRVVRSAWFLFSFFLLLTFMYWLLYGKPLKRPSTLTDIAIVSSFGFIFGMIFVTPLAGVMRLLIDWLSEVAGFDRAAWVAHQLKPLGIRSPAMSRVQNLVDTCHECAAYHQRLMLRNRIVRLVDFGVMVHLNNRSLVIRRV